ncbi:DUF4097 family beta strand repeat-containing protein [Brevibacillus dissolubilis]|uniref:DUF4097 family beta strand repeat-containing protein n=1 Tax=Brevibacillus dissolubilis TaxID=1844116 RepID=UPI00159B9DAE|nr:DUF4097 family beta strand repeat-containing protein [Brevibacillus dissolubilis]
MNKKIGRYQLALTLVALGTAILVDKLTGSQWLPRILPFWPLILIAVGGELVYRQIRPGDSGTRWQLDRKSIVLTGVIILIASFIPGFKTSDGDWGSLEAVQNGLEKNLPIISGPSSRVTLHDAELSASDIESVHINNSLGEVKVIGTDDPVATVKIDANIKAQTQEEAKSISSQLEVSVEQNGSELQIEVEEHKKLKEVYITVRVPRTVQVYADQQTGAIEVSKVTEAVLNTDLGSIQATDIPTAVKATSRAGAISLTDIGETTVKSELGSITIKNPAGKLDAENEMGEIKISTFYQIAGDWDVRNEMGSIEVMHPTDASFELTATAEMGEVEGKNLMVTEVGTGSTVSQTFGSGGKEITLETKAGSIELKQTGTKSK